MVSNSAANKKKEAYVKVVTQKIKNRKYLTNKAPGEFEDFEKEITVYDAVFFARFWSPQRKWLLANSINLEGFEEETEFQRLIKTFKLMERARDFKITEGLNYAADKVVFEKKLEVKKQKVVAEYGNAIQSLFKKKLLKRGTS